MKLYNFIVLFGTGIILLSFFVSLAFTKKEKPVYFRYISLFLLVGLVLSINTISNNNNAWSLNKKFSIFIEQILFLFQTILLSLFFTEILKNSKFLKTLKLLLFSTILIHFTLLIVVLTRNIEIRPILVLNLFLLVQCFFYLKDLMINKPTLILVKSSAFWIVMGIFFSSSISFPVNSLIPFIPKNQEYINLRFQIFSSNNMSLIVLYLFIIKSYLCLKHPQNL